MCLGNFLIFCYNVLGQNLITRCRRKGIGIFMFFVTLSWGQNLVSRDERMGLRIFVTFFRGRIGLVEVKRRLKKNLNFCYIFSGQIWSI